MLISKFCKVTLVYRLLSFGLAMSLMLAFSSCAGNKKTENLPSGNFQYKGVWLTHHYLESDGRRLHYVSGGDSSKTCLLIIHGSPGSWDDYKKYLVDSALRANFYIISVDRPGFGGSEEGNPLPSLSAQSSLVSKILDSLKSYNLPLIVMGHSYGGPLAVRFTIDNTNQVMHSILLAAAIDPACEEEESFRKILIKKWAQKILPNAIKSSNAELMTLKSDLLVMDKEWDKIKTPLLMIHGTGDMLVPYQNTVYARNKIADTNALKIIALKKVNHFIPWTHYSLVKSELLKLATPTPNSH